MRPARALSFGVIICLALALGALAAIGWALTQPAALRWAVDRAVQASAGRLQVETVRGSLAGGFALTGLRWRDDPQAAEASVEVRELSARWRLRSLLRGEFDLARLHASSVELRLASSDEPLVLPQSLSLPLALRLRAMRVDELRILPRAGEPVVLSALGLDARYVPGRYRVDRFEADSRWGRVKLSGTLGDAPPYALDLSAMLRVAIGATQIQPPANSASLDAAPPPSLPLEASAKGTLAELALEARLAAATEAGSAVARARLRPFDRQVLGAASFEAQGLDLAALGLAGAVRTQLGGRATLEPAAIDGAGSDAGGIEGPYQGELEFANTLPGTLETGALPLTALRGAFRWHGPEGLRVENLRVELPGSGRVEGRLQVDPSRSLALPGVRLPWLSFELGVAALDLQAISAALPASALTGRAAGNGERFELTLSDAARGGIALEARGRVDAGGLALTRAELRTGDAGGGARLSASGTLGVRAPHALAFEGRFQGLDPARLPALLALLARPAPRSAVPAATKARGQPAVAGDDRTRSTAAPPAEWLARLSGSLDGRWALGGELATERSSGSAARLRAMLEIERGVLGGLPTHASVEAEVEGVRLGAPDPQRMRVRLGRFELALGAARLQGRGALGAAGDRLGFELRVPELRRLAPLLPVDAALSGALSAQGELSGGFAQLGLDAQARASRLELGARLGVAEVALSLQVPTQALALQDAPLALHAEIRDLVAGGATVQTLRVDGDGSLRRHRLRASAGLPRASLRAVLEGALAADAGSWSGELSGLTAEGTLSARLAAPAPIEARAQSDGWALRVGAARIDSEFGSLRLARAGWQDGRGELALEARLSRLGRAAETLGLTGEVSGAGEALDALVFTLRAELAGSGIADLDGTVSAQLEGPPGAAGDGRAQLRLSAGVISGPLELTLPTLAIANRLIGPEWGVDGRLRFAGTVSGSVAAPRLTGDVAGSGLALQQHAMGWRLRDGTLAGRFDGERFRLSSMKLFSGPAPGAGSIEMRGEVRVADLEGRFDLSADRFAVLIGPGQRVVVSGQGQASNLAGAFEIKGSLRADEGRIELGAGDAPSLPDDVVIVARRDASAAGAGPVAAVRRTSLRLAAEVELDLGEKLRVLGSGIDAQLRGSVSLRGSLPEAPRAYGTVRIRQGRYRAYGQELQITRGRIVFNGPLDNPALDIVALRRDQAVEAGVAVTGTVLSPRVRLTSTPEVPDAEKLSWLVLGVPLDDARSGGQGAALQAAAATLFGSNDGALAGGLANALGLDVLTIRSGGTGGQGLLASSFGAGFGTTLPPIPGQVGVSGGGVAAAGVSDNVLTVGKRLGSRLLLTYEQGLHGVWNLLRIQYDITRRLSLRAQTGSESAIDLLYRFSFD